MAKSSGASTKNGADVIRRTFLNRLFSGNILLNLILLAVLFSLTSVDVHALTAPHTDYHPVNVTVQRSTDCAYVTRDGIDNVLRVGFAANQTNPAKPGTFEVTANISDALMVLGIEIADAQSIGLNTCPDSAWPVKTYNYTLSRWVYTGEFDSVGGSLADYISPANEMSFGFETFSTHLVNDVNVIPQFEVFLKGFEIAVTHLVPVGHVTSTLEPEAVSSLGATWSITNMDEFVSDCSYFGPIDYTVYNSGDNVTNMKVGNYRVSFGDVPGWNTPQTQDIIINEDSTTSVTAQYTMKLGAIQGFISPAGAVTAGAQWSVDGGSWQNSGDTVMDLPIGLHLVSFKPLAGWVTADDYPVMVYENQIANATRSYVESGFLGVSINPSSAVAGGAKWQLDGGAWQDSGITLSAIPVGSHTVSFKPMSGWDTPTSQVVSINQNQTASATGTYVQHVGSVTVNIIPAGALWDGAQWRLDGGSWLNSGVTVSNIPTGSHTITFGSIPGWDTPISQTIQVLRNLNTSITGDYGQRRVGGLRTMLTPSLAITEGAKWRVDDGAWSDSQTYNSEIIISVGTHTVSFKPLSGWDTPASQTVTINENQTTTVTGTYVQQIGRVKVNIIPSEAVSAGAQWQIDGGEWRNSGAILTGIPIGDHTIAFKSISGWDTPASQVIQVQTGQTTTASGTYVQQFGSLRVDLSPSQAAAAGARWCVDGGAWQNSGATVSSLTLGSHTITFNTLVGWDTPGAASVQIIKDSTTTRTDVYIQQIGSVSMTLAPPEAIAAGAKWRLDGGAWQDSGTLTGIPSGDHSIECNSIPGWYSPYAAVLRVHSGANTVAYGTYLHQVGSVSVSLAPAAAVNAGAQWQVDGGAWQNSGTSVSDVEVGNHSIGFKPVSDWETPANQTVFVTEGLTASTTGTYVQQVGSLSAEIAPSAAVSAGAQWQVDGGSWQNSGASVSGLVVGNHTIAFKSVGGWDTPTSQNVEVTPNSTSTATGTYVKQTGATKVDITPSAAISAGAQWKVDGGAWRNSGETVSGLDLGDHAITFKTIIGWTAPEERQIAITNGATTSVDGAYSVRDTHVDPPSSGGGGGSGGGCFITSLVR